MKKTIISLGIISSLLSMNAIADTFTMQPAPSYESNQNIISSSQIGQPQDRMAEQNRDYGFTANNRVETEKEKTQEDTKSAAEQGFYDQNNLNNANKDAQDYFYSNTARQKGIVVKVPSEDVGVAKDKTKQMWLINWKGRLVDRGISADKVNFEASRLNKEDFERWASRQLRYADE